MSDNKDMQAFLEKMLKDQEKANKEKIKPIGTSKGDAKIAPIAPANPFQELIIQLLRNRQK
jgi:predicted outer membrane protein